MAIATNTQRPSRTNAGMARDYWPLQFPDAVDALPGAGQGSFVYPGIALLTNSTNPVIAKVNGRVRHAVQVVGTFGSGESVAIQGSIDGVNWATLGLYAVSSPTTAITAITSTTGAGIYMVALQLPLILLQVSGGMATGSSLTITLASRY
jgi:hypothetical protein